MSSLPRGKRTATANHGSLLDAQINTIWAVVGVTDHEIECSIHFTEQDAYAEVVSYFFRVELEDGIEDAALSILFGMATRDGNYSPIKSYIEDHAKRLTAIYIKPCPIPKKARC